MSRIYPCGACGIESYDVAMTLVEVPEDERRMVPVLIGTQSVEVPEVYVREPRCHDTVACAARVAEFTKQEGVR